MEIINNLNANNDDQERKNDTAMEVPIEENRTQDENDSDVSDESTNKSTQEEQDYGIVFQTKIFERLQKIDSNISTLRINSELIKQELRENTSLMKHLLRRLLTKYTDNQEERHATKRPAEDSIFDDKKQM
jgi:hypothetical protein